MMSFFSKRKDGGKSNSDSSLYPPPSVATRRANTKGPEALDLATSAASPAAASPSGRWDGKCSQCRKLMSRCLCHEDHKSGGSPPRAPERSYSRSQQHDEDGGDKRHLLETLSGMHKSRSRSRVPLKMTQDRVRERRESQRFSNHTLLSSSSLSSPGQQGFAPTRSLSSKPPVHEQDPSSPSDRFTRSCNDVKWRSSNAITSTMRLAHDREMGPPRNGGQPKNLLKYDSRKVTNRYNHSASAATPAPTPTSSSTPQTLPRTASGNLYITTPITRRRKGDEENPDYTRVWEL